MTAKVTWLGKAADRVESDLIPCLTRELKRVFPSARTITVYDCFGGYSLNHREKAVLAVEVCGRGYFHTHVVKLGARAKVTNDYDGWRECVLRHNFASRILVSLAKKDLSGDRTAIIYEDAYRFFGSPEEGYGPQSLETVLFWSVMDNKPSPESVERVIRQIYADLYRWFYQPAGANQDDAVRFYQARLRRALDRWRDDAWRVELRRDVLWLLCSHDAPDALARVAYLDPYDYVTWALHHRRIPQTLVGRSHGDLHGRNVFVGVQRREAEYPAVFDYGEMHATNVLAWDFVKLETEIKVRLMALLYRDPQAQEVLFGLENEWLHRSALKRSDWPSVHFNAHSLRAHQMEFAYRFESVLALVTGRIHRLGDPTAPEPPGGRKITGEARLDRALGILMRIRQEAAFCLGEGQPQRGQCGLWSDEYYFALAVYGLATAKWDYKESESAFALVSAGVAAAQVNLALADIRTAIAEPPAPPAEASGGPQYASYHVPLTHAHRLWKNRHSRASLSAALAILEPAVGAFGHAVLLMQEYALLLAEAGQQIAALKILEPLNDLCQVFRDEETLARIGRTCKDLGDHSLSRQPVALRDLPDHPAWQWYRTAFQHYRLAFQMSRNYYPGINAATLALICGDQAEAQTLADQVLTLCREQDLSHLKKEDRFWVLVTQGEALLVRGENAEALTFYQQALSSLGEDGSGLAQSVYTQVCRLAWVLGLPRVSGVVDLFRCYPFKLDPGPLGRCVGIQPFEPSAAG